MGTSNILVLALAQALGSAGQSAAFFASGFVGSALAPSTALATLPVTASIVGGALASYPAAMLMRRIGRRWGFVSGAIVAALAAALALLAIARKDFALFCVAMVIGGINGAFVMQYRFAASESVEPSRSGTAVSAVLIGGVAAGLLGPWLGRRGSELLALGSFAGSFLLVIFLYAASALTLLFLRRVEPLAASSSRATSGGAGHPLAASGTGTAILAGCAAYAVMSFSMTAAPLGMHLISHHSLESAGMVVQSHIVAMYLPSFITGFLIARLGLYGTMVSGALLLAASAVTAFTGTQVVTYWAALVLLGLGWNLLFVGGTTLLGRAGTGEGRFRVQGTNDLLVVSSQAVASLLSSGALFDLGWRTMNLLVLPVIAAVLLALLRLRRAHPELLAAAPPVGRSVPRLPRTG